MIPFNNDRIVVYRIDIIFIFLQAVIDAAVKELLALKAEFKSVSGKDWSPALASAPLATSEKPSSAVNVDTLSSQVKTAGDKVRDLKAKKAEKVFLRTHLLDYPLLTKTEYVGSILFLYSYRLSLMLQSKNCWP